MIISRIQFSVSEDLEEQLHEILFGVLGATQAMPGCKEYNIYRSVHDSLDVVLLGTWQSDKDLEQYIRSDVFTRILRAMEISIAPPKTEFNHVLHSDGFELIDSIRG